MAHAQKLNSAIEIIRVILTGRQSDFASRIAFFYRPRLLVRHPEYLFTPLCAAGIFGTVNSPLTVVPFLLASVLLVFLRWYAGRRFYTHRDEFSELSWGWIAVGLSIIRGLVWAIFVGSMLNASTPELDAVLLLLLVGATWTSLGYATWIPALIAFPLVALAPVAFVLFQRPDTQAHLIAILLLLAIPMIGSNAFATGRLIIGAERLARRNVALSNRLVVERDRAQAGNRAKTAFLATMGHELKTPLNAMIGFSEIIALEQHATLPPIYRTYLADIISAGRHLVDVVNDILAMARLEAGRYVLTVAHVDLGEIAKGVLRVMELDADEAGVRLELQSPAAIEIDADSKALRQILINLISNAIKFSSSNSVVRIILSDLEDHLRIIVEDQGVGIEPTDIERVLRPFEQAESPLDRSHSGIGLGLPITLGLVELHGGRLNIDSRPGHGTRVIVDLPKTAGDALSLGDSRPWMQANVE